MSCIVSLSVKQQGDTPRVGAQWDTDGFNLVEIASHGVFVFVYTNAFNWVIKHIYFSVQVKEYV